MAGKSLFYLCGIFEQNHYSQVYARDKDDIKHLYLENCNREITSSNKIIKIKTGKVSVDYGGSIILADPLEIKVADDFKLLIRKESFHLFTQAITRNGFFEKQGNLYAFHCLNPITAFAYISDDLKKSILSYDFNQHLPDIDAHLERFNQAIADAKDKYAQQKQCEILSKIKDDLNNFKGNKKLN